MWVASLEVAEARYANLSQTLSSEERGRADSMAPIPARRFIVARGILRSLLSGFTGTAAGRLRFTYGLRESRRSPITNPFNVSHSAELGVFAFAPIAPSASTWRTSDRYGGCWMSQRFMSE